MDSQKSRSKSFLSNTLASVLLQLVTLITGLITPRTIIAVYGSSVNGLVSSLSSFISYISLVEAGIGSAAVYALYKPLSENDNHGISVIVSAAKRFYYKSGWIFVFLIAVLAFLYPLVVDCEGLSNIQVAILVFSLGASGFLDFFTLAKYRALLTASQRNWVIQLASCIYKILNAIVIVALANAGVEVEIVYIVAILPVIVRTLILTLYARKVFPEVDYNAEEGKTYKLDQRWDAFLLQVLGAVHTGWPTISATFILQDLSMVSVFSVYRSVATNVQNICAAFSNGTQASFGDVIARGETETLKRAYREFQILVYSLSAVVCGISFVAIQPFVDLYTADIADVSYYYPLIGFLVILDVLLYHLKTPQGLLVISAGHYRQTRVQVIMQTLILIVCSIIFGLMWGVEGIMLGSILANIYRDIDLAFYIPKNVTHTKVSETFGYMLLTVVECAITVLPFALLQPTCSGWLDWILLCVVVGVWGILVCLLGTYIFAREQFMGLWQRVKNMVKHS